MGQGWAGGAWDLDDEKNPVARKIRNAMLEPKTAGWVQRRNLLAITGLLTILSMTCHTKHDKEEELIRAKERDKPDSTIDQSK